MLACKVTTKSEWHVLLLGCAQQEVRLCSHTKPTHPLPHPTRTPPPLARFALIQREAGIRWLERDCQCSHLLPQSRTLLKKLFRSAECSRVVFLFFCFSFHVTNQVTAQVKRWRGKYAGGNIQLGNELYITPVCHFYCKFGTVVSDATILHELQYLSPYH